jgi:hypothetical protein
MLFVNDDLNTLYIYHNVMYRIDVISVLSLKQTADAQTFGNLLISSDGDSHLLSDNKN